MVAVPPKTPLTMPVAEPTLAIPVLLLDHTPPAVGWLNVLVVPWHIVVIPVIPDDEELTVITA
jgi:hypothetical protein